MREREILPSAGPSAVFRAAEREKLRFIGLQSTDFRQNG